MKYLNYFSFIQALLCTLVSTKHVCNYVQFFYFIQDFNNVCKRLENSLLDFTLKSLLQLWYCFIFFIHCTKFMQKKKKKGVEEKTKSVCERKKSAIKCHQEM